MARRSRAAKTKAKQKLRVWVKGEVPKAPKTKRKIRPAPLAPLIDKTESEMVVLGPFKTKEDAEQGYLDYMEKVVEALPGTPPEFSGPDFEALLDSLAPKTPVPMAPYPVDKIPTFGNIADGWMNGQYPAWAAEHLMGVAHELRKEHQ